jgi:hypothetical protein
MVLTGCQTPFRSFLWISFGLVSPWLGTSSSSFPGSSVTTSRLLWLGRYSCILYCFSGRQSLQTNRLRHAARIHDAEGSCYDLCSTTLHIVNYRSEYDNAMPITIIGDLTILSNMFPLSHNIMDVATFLTAQVQPRNDYHKARWEFFIGLTRACIIIAISIFGYVYVFLEHLDCLAKQTLQVFPRLHKSSKTDPSTPQRFCVLITIAVIVYASS